MGPLLYTLFTNELPEVIHDTSDAVKLHEESDNMFPAYHMEDKTNGSMCCYADDGTLTVTMTMTLML